MFFQFAINSNIDFLTFSNGADTSIPVQPYSCILYDVKGVIECIEFINDDYDLLADLPGFFIIGSNGGGEYIVLELKSSRVCCVYFSLTEEDLIEIAPTFIDLLKLFGHSEEIESV